MPSDSQAAVMAWLAIPASYPDRPVRVERIDTHSASVFLAGERAYKVKRAVRYTFLDFSTLERRRQSCEAEVRLNRRTAPALYLGVTPVTREPSGALQIGGDGPAVEWLVVMHRFPQERLLDRLALSGGVTAAIVAQLADAVAAFHASAAPTPHRGELATMRAVADDNTRALAEARDLLDQEAASTLAAACDAALVRHGRLVEARRAGGFVRQCHGDLHLRNIVLLDEGPTLFDAVEFNEDFACIDVWYDLAFLLMDMVGRGLSSEANLLFNQYVLRTSDLGGLPLLPLFLGCRAAIRAKTSLASAALETAPSRRGEYEARAREYLALAVRLVRSTPPRLVAVGGLSGSGKSTLAALIAPRLGGPPGAVVLRSDLLRKALLHHGPEDRLGPEGYTPEVTETVYRAVEMRAADVLAAGGSVIADATFLDPAARLAVAAIAERAGVPFTGFWLETPAEIAAERLRQRQHDASDATVEVLERQRAIDTDDIAWIRLDASRPAAELVDLAINAST